MSNFLNDMKRQSTLTETINGAVAYETTQNAVLDFFAESSALRNANESRIIKLFENSYLENPLLTLKCLFYTRDIRGGQGERRIFKILLTHLANTRPSIVKANLNIISEYGRYDDYLCLLDTPLKKDVLNLIKNQLEKDIVSKHPSLLAKWIPNCDTTSLKSRHYAHQIRCGLGMKEKEYRKMLSSLREKIKVTERLITANRWSELQLDKLTANNYLKYDNAFRNHIQEKWSEYIYNVQNGNSSIKSATLYPYNIINKLRETDKKDSLTLYEEIWNALPDYTNGQIENALCMVDVSGSMYVGVSGSVTALDVAISLGLYISERVQGVFNNHFMTFSSKPEIVKIKGNTLKEKIVNMSNADWGMNTNLGKAFQLILDTAKRNNTPKEDMPKKLIIISDMQFDSACRNREKTIFESFKEEFEENGYDMPTVVFWNVNSTKTAFQVSEEYKNVLLCSGCSPVILKGVLKYTNPMELVLDTLNNPRYDLVTI